MIINQKNLYSSDGVLWEIFGILIIMKPVFSFFRYVHIWKWWISWVKDNKGTKDPKWDLFEVVSEDLI